MCAAKSDDRFAPISDRESGFSQRVMSALHPKADTCGISWAAVSNDTENCGGPQADTDCKID